MPVDRSLASLLRVSNQNGAPSIRAKAVTMSPMGFHAHPHPVGRLSFPQPTGSASACRRVMHWEASSRENFGFFAEEAPAVPLAPLALVAPLAPVAPPLPDVPVFAG
jgi:hypothetical protein